MNNTLLQSSIIDGKMLQVLFCWNMKTKESYFEVVFESDKKEFETFYLASDFYVTKLKEYTTQL